MAWTGVPDTEGESEATRDYDKVSDRRAVWSSACFEATAFSHRRSRVACRGRPLVASSLGLQERSEAR